MRGTGSGAEKVASDLKGAVSTARSIGGEWLIFAKRHFPKDAPARSIADQYAARLPDWAADAFLRERVEKMQGVFEEFPRRLAGKHRRRDWCLLLAVADGLSLAEAARTVRTGLSRPLSRERVRQIVAAQYDAIAKGE